MNRMTRPVLWTASSLAALVLGAVLWFERGGTVQTMSPSPSESQTAQIPTAQSGLHATLPAEAASLPASQVPRATPERSAEATPEPTPAVAKPEMSHQPVQALPIARGELNLLPAVPVAQPPQAELQVLPPQPDAAPASRPVLSRAAGP